MQIKGNLFSFIGLLFGALALLLALFHFWAGPFTPHATLETLVAGKITSVREAAISALMGNPVQEVKAAKTWNIDIILTLSTSMLAVVAIVLGVIAGFYKENRWGVRAALFFGLGVLTFQIAMFWLSVLLVVLLIVMLASALTGNLSF